ncbi:MAG: membrane integrity-associated transporter subunit PqiC [Gammaproteobacteria bacterium]|nr:membrane integrity-associated transporter subunit PqiC [Gammaproteobacteria bacterium]
MRLAFILCSVLLLGACAGRSGPVSYYLLEAMAPAAAEAQSSATIRLLPVELADYLRRTALVSRQGGLLLIDDGQQWAGTLEDEVTRVMVTNLNRIAGGVQVQPSTAPDRPALALQLRIDRLDGVLGGALRLEGAFTLVDERNDVVALRLFTISRPAGATIAELVEAHSLALADLAAAIAPLLPRS